MRGIAAALLSVALLVGGIWLFWGDALTQWLKKNTSKPIKTLASTNQSSPIAKPPQPAHALRDTTSAITTLISALQQEAKQHEIAMLEQLDARYRHFLVAIGALRTTGSIAPNTTAPDPKKNIPKLAENAPKKSPAPTKGGRRP